MVVHPTSAPRAVSATGGLAITYEEEMTMSKLVRRTARVTVARSDLAPRYDVAVDGLPLGAGVDGEEAARLIETNLGCTHQVAVELVIAAERLAGLLDRTVDVDVLEIRR
jgi:hypothetical protein